MLLNLGLVTALVVVGLAAHSLAVFAAGADYLADATAIGVSLLAIWLAARPRGYPKATTVAALVNAGWLLTLNTGIAVAAAQRLAAGAHQVQGLPVLVVSAVAALVMLTGALILGGDADDADGSADLNVKAVLLDTAADAAAAAGVAVSGAVILGAGGWYWLDPATALAIAVIVGYHALKLIREITARLMALCAGQQRLSVALEDENAVFAGETGVVADAVECVAQADLLSEGEVGAEQDVVGRRDRGEGVQDRLGGLLAHGALGGRR
jgi:cobalt-zinc-cadmium efflux system protein